MQSIKDAKWYSGLRTWAFLFCATLLLSCNTQKTSGFIGDHQSYTLSYTRSDESNVADYQAFFTKGKKAVEEFFQSSFIYEFNIHLHPTRESLDSTWQNDWNLPDFKSQCWMVASGVATKLDIISPKKWDSIACEHSYSDKIKTQRLVTHELVHVFHGQHNVSPDFSNINGIDWFVEGLATYASGQCDESRIAEVKNAILNGEVPDTLGNFWSGNLRYGLSGSVVMYLDHKYGRERLVNLLKYNDITDLLTFLGTTESEIMLEWKNYMNEI